jgi:hypothetical protein
MLKLNKKQLQEVIKNELREENGLNEIFKMTLESLMYLEREAVVSQDAKNKGNGYRTNRNRGRSSYIRCSV